eukprot:15791466-Heterocapsa_arctica.AAC.1
MTECSSRCPPGPGLNEPWWEIFPVPIFMLDVSSNRNKWSNTEYTGSLALPENPYIRNVVRHIQMSLAEETSCKGIADSTDGQEF